MRNEYFVALLFFCGTVLILAASATNTSAQQTSPQSSTGTASPPQTSSDRNRNTGAYEVTSSIEVGVRGVAIDGNADKYRSDLNYTPGFKLFDTSLLMQSNGSGSLGFDKLLVNSFGWKDEPNGYLRLNAEDTKWYKFDAKYRRFDYFNNLNNFALQQHSHDTRYRQGDFDLVLMPKNRRVNVNLGYSLTRNTGPSGTTYNYSGDQYPILLPLRYGSNEYRVGADVKLAMFDLSVEQGWRFFKEDSSYSIDTPQAGNNTLNQSAISSFRRDLPTRGRSPFTRASLHTLLGKRLDVTGRYIYAGGETRVSLFETAMGKNAAGNNIVLDTFTASGKARRPSVIGDLGFTLAATSRLHISNTVRLNTSRINGSDSLRELQLLSRTTPAGTVALPPISLTSDFGRTQNYRRFFNQVEVDYDFHRRFSAYVGHRYTDRHIVLARLDGVPGTEPAAETLTFDNRTNTYIVGFEAKPFERWSVYFDVERGKADDVFTRVEPSNFTNVRVRSILRPTRALAINTSLVTKNNTNPPNLSEDPVNLLGIKVASRIASSSVDWTPSGRFSLSSGYTHSRVTSDYGVIFFLANSAETIGRSEYFVRDNFAFLTTSIELHPRVRFYAGYRINSDKGQGDRISKSPALLIGSYPVQFQSPEGRISVRLQDRIDWIAGYQYFDFKERFGNSQFYQAHLPYTSIKFYFGRRE